MVVEEDQRLQAGTQQEMRGSKDIEDFEVKSRSLYWMQECTGNQWRDMKGGVTWSWELPRVQKNVRLFLPLRKLGRIPRGGRACTHCPHAAME